MKIWFLILLYFLLPLAVMGQAYQTGFVYRGVASGLPGTCIDGQLAAVTDAISTAQIYVCVLGSWVQQTGGGGGGTPGGSTDSTQYNAGGGNFGGAGPGTAGQVFESNGAGMAPSFQDPIVSGPDATGAAQTKNPVAGLAGIDYGTGCSGGPCVQEGKIDSTGHIYAVVAPTTSANTSGNPFFNELVSGSTTAVTQATASNLNAEVVGAGTAGSPVGGVVSVQGVSSGTALPVSGMFYQSTQPVSIASGQVASGALASGAVASGAYASGSIASGACVSGCMADGALTTLGAEANAKSTATDTTAVTTQSVLKEISYMAQNPAALPADQSVNVAQVNGTTTLTGAGATGTGAQRETVSQDTTTIAGSAPGTAGTASANVVTVQGVASMTPVQVSQVTASNLNAQVVGAGADGSATSGNPVLIAGKGSGNARVPIVCDNWTPISLASTTALKVVTKSSGKNVYICSIDLISATAQNVALVAGTLTTTNCDTSTAGLAGGTTAATGWNFAANGGLTQGTGIGAIIATASTGLDVCLFSSSTGQISGVISWTQF